MNDLKTLVEERQNVIAQLERIERDIARHPDLIKEELRTILALFDVDTAALQPIVERVTSVRHTEGVTDSRKNMMKYRGVQFTLRDDPIKYEVRFGNNWCSRFQRLYLGGGPGIELDPATIDENEAAIVVERLAKMAAPVAIAYLMFISEL